MYKHITKTLRSPEKSHIKNLIKKKFILWRKEENFITIEKSSNLTRARRLGYKAKQGYILVRCKVRKGSFKKRAITGGRRPKRTGITKRTVGKSLQRIAEERSQKRFKNLEVLNSYWVGKDGMQEWFEVILIDKHHPVIKKDKNINWICGTSHKGRVYRGKTSAAKRGRGLYNKGKGSEKIRPSLKANNNLGK